MECKETSQLAGKAYEDSDYTMVIAIVHWLKLIVTVQKLFCLPVDCHCLSRQLQLWRHKTIFCVKASDTACIWSLQEFYKLLMTYSQLLLFQKPASYWNSTVLSKSVYVSYPGCILWATVYPVSYYALIGISHCITQAAFERWMQTLTCT